MNTRCLKGTHHVLPPGEGVLPPSKTPDETPFPISPEYSTSPLGSPLRDCKVIVNFLAPTLPPHQLTTLAVKPAPQTPGVLSTLLIREEEIASYSPQVDTGVRTYIWRRRQDLCNCDFAGMYLCMYAGKTTIGIPRFRSRNDEPVLVLFSPTGTATPSSCCWVPCLLGRKTRSMYCQR